MISLLLAALPAHASSLDNMEIGGAWGTPVADNPTAVWWNPSGVASGGTKFLVEAAPILASVGFDREDPYGHGGHDEYKLNGIVPFAGFMTDFGVHGIGAGVGLVIPYARGGDALSHINGDPPGPAAFVLQHGNSQTAMLMGALGAKPPGIPIGVGAGFGLVDTTWYALLDSEVTTQLDSQICGLNPNSCADDGHYYSDDQIESQDYATLLEFHDLKSRTFMFNLGLRGDFDKVKVGASYVHGSLLKNEGDVTLSFGCPPQSDTLGRFGSEQYGLCNSTLEAHGRVDYRVPSRIHLGVQVLPIDKVKLEAMGGYVFWHVYDDFDITVDQIKESNPSYADDCTEGCATQFQKDNTPALVEQHRKWARDNRDTYWMGVDGKVDATDWLLLGGRVIYDHAAVPQAAVSPNNWDASDVLVGGLVQFKPTKWLGIGAQYTHHFVFTRVVDNSEFLVTLDPNNAPPDRYFYPQMNGKYTGQIHRFGLSVSGSFGGKKDDDGFSTP